MNPISGEGRAPRPAPLGCATATDSVDVQSPCVRCSATYSGPHGFEVSVQKQPKETKSATWTVNTCIINNRLCSPISHKLFVAYTRGFSCGIWRRKAHATLQYRPYTCAYQYYNNHLTASFPGQPG